MQHFSQIEYRPAVWLVILQSDCKVKIEDVNSRSKSHLAVIYVTMITSSLLRMGKFGDIKCWMLPGPTAFCLLSNWPLWNTICNKMIWDSKVIMITPPLSSWCRKKGHKQKPLQGQQQTFYLSSNELIKFSKGWMIGITPVPVKQMCTHSNTPGTGNNRPRTETSDLNIHHLSVCLWGPFRLNHTKTGLT